jgi:hypothetical protein
MLVGAALGAQTELRSFITDYANLPASLQGTYAKLVEVCKTLSQFSPIKSNSVQLVYHILIFGLAFIFG